MQISSVGKNQIQVLHLLLLLVILPFVNTRPTTRRINHKRLKRARIEALKTEILTKLGMEEPSNAKLNMSIEDTRKLIRQYRKSIEESQGQVHTLFDEEDFYAKTFHTFTNTGLPKNSEVDKHIWSNSSHPRLYFRTDIAQPDEAQKEVRVHSAKLKVFSINTNPSRLKDKTNIDKRIALNVYQFLEPLQKDKLPVRRLIDTKLISLLNPDWVTFDVNEAVQYWVDHPDKNYGIEITSDIQELNDIITFSIGDDADSNNTMDDTEKETYSPTLDIYTQDKLILSRTKRNSRSRSRASRVCTRRGRNNRCCRYKLTVDFQEDLEWHDFVIHPQTFDAYYCDGTCHHHRERSNHWGVIQQVLKLGENPAANPAPCCSASKLAPLTVLLINEQGKPEEKVINDLIVKECKCM